MPRTVRRQHPVAVTGENGQLTAAASLSRTVLHPDVTGVIDDYKRLTSEQAQMAFADHFLGRTAGVMDEIWPTFYQLLKCVEDAELYRKPGYLAGDRTFGSFKDYFEYRVGRPFVTWIELEQTYHYAEKYAQYLFEGSYDKARQIQEANQRDQEQQRPHGGDRRSADIKFDNIQLEAPTGTSQARALRKLRTEAESGNVEAAELHAEVLAGHISPHAAMVKAGFRRRTVTVRIDDPESAARTLRACMSRESLLRLAELLTKEE